MSLKNNRFITIFNIKIKNIGPMKIGNGDEGILLDKVTNSPYLPGTSIAGAMRAYAVKCYGDKKIEKIFGNGYLESNIYISDAYAINKKEIEYRPGLRIDNDFGVADKKAYFERELLATGHEFNLKIKLFSCNHEVKEEQLTIIKTILSAIKTRELRFGGNKTNGCGTVEIEKVDICNLDLENISDYISYIEEDYIYTDIKDSYITEKNNFNTIRLTLTGETQNPILVKGFDNLDYNLPDGSNIVNYEGKYIIPGTSFKGVFRNQFNKICKYKNKNDLTEKAFGQDNKSEKKKAGRIYVEDVIIENALDKAVYNRIKIDQFTGGVRSGAILNHNPVVGNFKTEILYKKGDNKEEDNQIVAIILFAIKDILKGQVAVGSGEAVGRGKLKGAFINLEVDGMIAKLDLNGNNHENRELIAEIISSIN